MAARTLVASINGQPVGELGEVAGLWSFTYVESWLENAQRYPLSPHLALRAEPHIDGGSNRPVQWFFDNLLPEEAQRTLLATDAKIDAADAFGLLAYYGAESAGALTLLPPEAQVPAGGLRPLPDADLSARIKALPNAPLGRHAVKRMSLAGAQHKLAVVIENGALFEPIGAQPSTHILKPDHPDEDYPHSVINEWFSMRLARALGLEVPDVERRYVPEPVYLIRRFDRQQTAAEWRRLHAIDACQLLNLDRSFKYARGSVETLAALAELCRSPALARTRLFNWLVFNVLLGNGDAHLKNLSFLVTSAGIQPAPFYDLLSTAIYDSRLYQKQGWPDGSTLAWPVMGAGRFSALNRPILIDAARTLGLQAATAERLISRQHGRIVGIAEEMLAEIEAGNDGIVTPQGEQRCLRGVLHTIIREMAGRLT
ncbi:HipA domain-containing protein [Prosthecodimorpha staleyi]|uniref:HipA domain-containing protein n=1 Tax=Prosthecodimorpha staleyi TaxID=2840188 RepID=A0A947GGB0_9HYPH|nr:HipA domain-containing protein [Prosthecodimorpha staleyi]MBT9291830.1 HipA domain-containing protein [Prosthecodimorpha staleyi]